MRPLSANAKPEGFLKNKLWMGLGVGLLLPLMSYGILLFINDDLIVEYGILGDYFDVFARSGGFSKKLLMLIAICTNIIPSEHARRNRKDNLLRGVIVPTVIGAIAWAFYYNAFSFGAQ